MDATNMDWLRERVLKLQDDIDSGMGVLVYIEHEQLTENIVYENLTRQELLEQITSIRASIETAICYLGQTIWSEPVDCVWKKPDPTEPVENDTTGSSDKKESNDTSSADE